MSEEHLVSRQDQFRIKEAGRRAAAQAPFEEKFAKLIELQKINYELARQTGRPAKPPWNIRTQKPDSKNLS
jgi:hypothetical protein